MKNLIPFLCFILLFGGCAGYAHKYNVGDKVGIIRRPTGVRGDGTKNIDEDTTCPVGIVKAPSPTSLKYFVIVNGQDDSVIINEQDMFLIQRMDWTPVNREGIKIEKE